MRATLKSITATPPWTNRSRLPTPTIRDPWIRLPLAPMRARNVRHSCSRASESSARAARAASTSNKKGRNPEPRVVRRASERAKRMKDELIERREHGNGISGQAEERALVDRADGEMAAGLHRDLH